MIERRILWGLRPQTPFYSYDLADLGFILDSSKKRNRKLRKPIYSRILNSNYACLIPNLS